MELNRVLKSSGLVLITLLTGLARIAPAAETGAEARAYTVSVLTRIARPPLTALAHGRLHEELPVHRWERNRTNYSGLEALGRTVAGIAPWLELGPDDTAEGKLRGEFIALTVKAIANGTDPKSPDFLNFTQGGQPLVDAAFLAHGLLRAPKQLWARLTPTQQTNVVAALKATRGIKPGESNWLLFSAMVEAALWQFNGECELKPIEYAVQRHMEWYQGDGTYGDGAEFHWDYYNSFVIQPMLLDVLRVCETKQHSLGELYPKVLGRARRYAEVQERLISPEGTFPVIGRSSAYRFGALQHLATVALLKQLSPETKPAAVRGALTAVVRRMTEAPGTFDERGWLQVGAVGHQPAIRESYIATGSLYLCLTGLVHLGLPPNDPFWTVAAEDWTQKRIWSGHDTPADKAYKEPNEK
jgi:hypothetical protein